MEIEFAELLNVLEEVVGDSGLSYILFLLRPVKGDLRGLLLFFGGSVQC